jgi:hypothetical protein
MSGSIERPGVQLAAREVQKCAHCWFLPVVWSLKSRQGHSSPQTLRAQETSGHRQVACCNLAAEPCAIPRWQMLRGKARSRRSKSLLLCYFLVHAWQCATLRNNARCFSSILPQVQSLCCFIAERFKMRNLRSSCWQRINVCSLLY